MSKVLIIGGGAAGMMAGVFAARNHHEVHILEKNEKLGKKVFITGKGRCNVANACDTEELFPAVMSNPKFLYSGFYSFGPQDVMNFFEEAGVPLKVERGNRVFPQSDHSSDIIRALERELKKAGAKVHLHTTVKEIVKKPEAEKVTGVILEDGTFMEGDAVIVATGGFSYQSTGSTGDGYRFARELGLKVTDISPSLVPLKTKEDYIPKLQGLSLKNTGLTIKNGKKVLYEDFGEMMFTHFGVTGPMILSASAHTVLDALQGLSQDVDNLLLFITINLYPLNQQTPCALCPCRTRLTAIRPSNVPTLSPAGGTIERLRIFCGRLASELLTKEIFDVQYAYRMVPSRSRRKMAPRSRRQPCRCTSHLGEARAQSRRACVRMPLRQGRSELSAGAPWRQRQRHRFQFSLRERRQKQIFPSWACRRIQNR